MGTGCERRECKTKFELETGYLSGFHGMGMENANEKCQHPENANHKSARVNQSNASILWIRMKEKTGASQENKTEILGEISLIYSFETIVILSMSTQEIRHFIRSKIM
jgi:hypothetical protein